MTTLIAPKDPAKLAEHVRRIYIHPFMQTSSITTIQMPNEIRRFCQSAARLPNCIDCACRTNRKVKYTNCTCLHVFRADDEDGDDDNETLDAVVEMLNNYVMKSDTEMLRQAVDWVKSVDEDGMYLLADDQINTNHRVCANGLMLLAGFRRRRLATLQEFALAGNKIPASAANKAVAAAAATASRHNNAHITESSGSRKAVPLNWSGNAVQTTGKRSRRKAPLGRHRKKHRSTASSSSVGSSVVSLPEHLKAQLSGKVYRKVAKRCLPLFLFQQHQVEGSTNAIPKHSVVVLEKGVSATSTTTTITPHEQPIAVSQEDDAGAADDERFSETHDPEVNDNGQNDSVDHSNNRIAVIDKAVVVGEKVSLPLSLSSTRPLNLVEANHRRELREPPSDSPSTE